VNILAIFVGMALLAGTMGFIGHLDAQDKLAAQQCVKPAPQQKAQPMRWES